MSASLKEPGRFAAMGGALSTAMLGFRDAARWHPGWLTLACGLYVIQSLLPAAQVLLINRLLIGMTGDRGAIFLPLLGLTVVVGTFFPVAQVAWQCGHRLGLRLSVDYQKLLVHAAADLTPRQLAEPNVGAALENADTATDALGAVPGQAMQLASTFLTAASLCAAIWRVSAWSAALVGLALVPTVIAFTIIARIEMAGLPALGESMRKARYSTELLVQQRTGTELATLQSGHAVADRAVAARREYLAVLDRLTAVGTRLELAGALATAIMLGAALSAMISTQSTVVGAASAIAGVVSALHAVRASANSFGMLISASPKSAAFRDFLQLVSPRVAPRVRSSAKELVIRDLSYTYPGADRPAIEDVCISAKTGEIVALVGANGAGKTTTINCVLGALNPSGGVVLLDGDDLARLSDQDRLSRFGLMTQEFGRYEFTIREVLSLAGQEPRTDQQLWEALKFAEASDFVQGLPRGLDAQLGQQWGGVGLSGGQWQRLSLARIYLRAAGVWVLDEPTSAIDAEAERTIFDQLALVKRDHITILVSHRAWTLRAVDRIFVFDRGRVVQEGTYAELASKPGRFLELFNEQLGDQPDAPE